MLRKFVSIKNVGRLANFKAGGDVELKRYNLIFAENGRGKTTLCAILRSLQSANAAHIMGRKTLASLDTPNINILTATGNSIFADGAWSATTPEIAIFDSTFVSENVFAGDVVHLEHRRSLYSVIVGAQGVVLAHQIEELDAQSRAKSTEIRDKAAIVQGYIPADTGLTVEPFAALSKDLEIDTKIAEKEKELEAVKQAASIRARSSLSELTLPQFDKVAIETLLGKSVEGIAVEAQNQINKQIIEHAMFGHGYEWLLEGLGYIHETSACPFCGQALAGASSLVGTYKDYFSAAYDRLRKNISQAREDLQAGFSDRAIAAIERIVDQNVAGAEFWGRFCALADPALPAGAGDTLRSLRDAASALIDMKAAGPLEKIEADEAFTEACCAFSALAAAVSTYNEATRAANAIITAKKAATSLTSTVTVQSQLTHLQAIKKRHEADPNRACLDHKAAVDAKKAIDENKERIRKQLDEYTETVIGPYQNSINDILSDFNAGFRITNTSHGYAGGVASSAYKISINNTPVELGDADTPLDRPSFRNTLSSGDKSTLALAFFLAQLMQDSQKANKIVVFDDPFNSQDSFRRECTVVKIKKCGELTAQVLVLSHDAPFLKRIWDRLEPAERKALTLSRIDQTNSTIRPWDIETEMLGDYQAQRRVLTDYYLRNLGDPRDVVQKIRLVLETHYRRLGSGLLEATDNLGAIVIKIRTAGASHDLAPVCDKLDELNIYTCRYHHGENPNSANEQLDSTELQGYVGKTLSLSDG